MSPFRSTALPKTRRDTPPGCPHNLPSHVGTDYYTSARAAVHKPHMKKKTLTFIVGGYMYSKSSTLSCGALCWHYLFSRPVARQLSSAHMCLTSVFGMGTGGPTWQSTPTILLYQSPFELRSLVTRGRIELPLPA